VLALCGGHLFIEENPRGLADNDRGKGKSSGSCYEVEKRNPCATEPFSSVLECLNTCQYRKLVPESSVDDQEATFILIRGATTVAFAEFAVGAGVGSLYGEDPPPLERVRASVTCDPGQFLGWGFPLVTGAHSVLIALK
jgi:hypothetical protein